MPGYRITARSLQSQGLSEQVLREFTDIEAFAAIEPEALDLPADKVVFVLEEDDVASGPTLSRRP